MVSRTRLLACLGLTSVCGCAWLGELSQFDGAVDAPGDAAVDAAPADADAAADAVDPSAEDGAATASDATMDMADGGSDASLEASRDAPPDARSDSSDGPSPTWCAVNSTAATVLCRDFDDGQPYNAVFSGGYNNLNGGPPPSLDTADFASSPNSLLLQLPALASWSNNEQMQLSETMPFHDTVHLEVAMKISNYDEQGGSTLSFLRLAYGVQQYYVTWDYIGNVASVDENSENDAGSWLVTGHPVTFPPANTWFNLDIELSLSAHTLSVTVNGSPALTSGLASEPLSNPTPRTGEDLQLIVGLNWANGPTKGANINYDNILIQGD